MKNYRLDLGVWVFWEAAEDDGVFYFLLSREEVGQTGQVFDEGGLDSKRFIVIKVKVFFSEPVLLEEVDGEIMRGIVEKE